MGDGGGGWGGCLATNHGLIMGHSLILWEQEVCVIENADHNRLKYVITLGKESAAEDI